MSISRPKALTELPLIYYRSFISYPGILDLIDIFGQQPMAELALQQILKNQDYEETIIPEASLIDKVRHLYFENKNIKKKTGLSTMGIGYPLLCFRHNQQLIVAPLFIWPIQIEAHPQSSNKWQLSYFENHQIRVNPYLLNYWQTYYGWSYKSIQKEFKTYPTLLKSTIQNLLEKIHAENFKDNSQSNEWHVNPPFSLNRMAHLSTFENTDQNPTIHWSAVVGNFNPIFQYLPVQISALKNEVNEKAGSPFGMGQLNPQHYSALELTRQFKTSLVKGSNQESLPLLMYLLTNQLSNGNTTLIISDQQQTLNHIFEELGKLELQSLAFLFDNSSQNWRLLQKLISQTTPKETPSFDNNTFESKQSFLLKLKNQLDQNYAASRKSVFQGMDFKETVGYFLHFQQQEGKELLDSQISENQYLFSNAEFEEIHQAIDLCYSKYQRINTLNHPLETLHPSIFVEPDSGEAKKILSIQIENLEKKLRTLHHQYISKVDQYSEKLHKYYHSVLQQMEYLLQEIKSKLKIYQKQYGVDFQLTSLASLRLISNFSSRHKAILKAKEEVITLYQMLVQYHENHAYFGFQFKSASEKRNLSRWEPDLEDFEQFLGEWKSQLPEQIKKELLRLSPGNTKSNLEMDGEIQELETALETAVEQINSSELFKEKFNNVMLTSLKQQKYVESLVEKIEQTRVFIRDFEAFFDWKKTWFNLSQKAQSLIRALTKVKPQNWKAAFNSWFLYHRIRLSVSENIPAENLELASFDHHFKLLQAELPKQIRALWASRNEKARKDWKNDDKSHFQLVNAPQKPESDYFLWVDLIPLYLPYLTQKIPLFLSTSSAALALSDKGNFKFDTVVLLEGSHKSLHEAQSAFLLGKRIVILGDENQKHLFRHSKSLWDYLEELPYAKLDSENVDPLKGYSPQDQIKEKDDIQILQVDGRYEEKEEANLAEAQETIRLLNEIQQKPGRIYPKVNIVCMTYGQRNLINTYLLDIKQRNLPGKEKIQQLERNGLSVYAIEEVPFPSSDLLILNNTYGTIDLQGQISEKVDRWKKSRFEEQVKFLFSTPFQQIYIVNSLPDTTLSELEMEGSTYSYFLRSPKKEFDGTKRDDNKPESSGKGKNMSSKLYFAKEVTKLLKPYLESHRLELNKDYSKSSKIILIQSKDVPDKKVGILADGFFADSPSTHFSWEYNQIERFKSQGIHIIYSWPIRWWQDPQTEAQRLIQEVSGILNN